jgi:hypothetical protein
MAGIKNLSAHFGHFPQKPFAGFLLVAGMLALALVKQFGQVTIILCPNLTSLAP